MQKPEIGVDMRLQILFLETRVDPAGVNAANAFM